MFSMAYMPTPEAVVLAQRTEAAVRTLRLRVKEIVDVVGLSETYILDMFAGRRPLSLWRFFRIDGFKVAFGKQLLRGADYLVLPRGDIRVIRVGKRPAVKAALRETRVKDIA